MTHWKRRGYELDVLFLNRPVRPFHLAVTLATATIAVSMFLGHPADGWSGWAAHLLATVALTSAMMLTIGWWTRNDWCAEWGLLLAVGVWTARAVYALIDPAVIGVLRAPWLSALLSVAWVVGAGGAYLLERIDHGSRGEE